MAFLASVAEITMMLIVFTVTAYTVGRRSRWIGWPGMAGRTDQPLMLAGQGITGGRIMIKTPCLPRVNIVTFGAGGRCAECTGMMVVLVAGLARHAL